MKTPRDEACNGFGFQDDDGACDADSGYHCKTCDHVTAKIEKARADGVMAVDRAVVRLVGNLTTDGIQAEFLRAAFAELGVSDEVAATATKGNEP